MPRTALIVDDSRSLRAMLADALADAGFQVIECRHGREALEQAPQQHIDLVISDVNMPVMDGISFVKQLRTLADFKFTPVIILTTESEQAIKQRGREAGATGWMVKPFSPAQLISVVQRLVP